MARHIAFAGALLVLMIGGFFAWRATRDSPIARTPESSSTAQTESKPTAVEVLRTEKPTESVRTPVASPPNKPAPQPSKNAALRILAISKETKQPLPQIRAMLVAKVKPKRRWNETMGSHATLDEVPISGEDGRVEFDVPPGVAFHLSGYSQDQTANTFKMEVEPLATGEMREIVLELATADDLVFCGRVVDRATREPVPGATITVHVRRLFDPRGSLFDPQRPSSTSSYEDTRRRSTDPDGRFQLAIASWREPALEVSVEGYATVFVPASKGHEMPDDALTIELAHAASLHLHLVLTDPAPARGASVSVQALSISLGLSGAQGEWSGKTDADGVLRITGLPPGVPLKVEATTIDGRKQSQPEPLLLQPGETREIEWRLGGACRVHGRVVDQNGKPVAKCMVRLEHATDKRPGYFNERPMDEAPMVATDPDGRFHFDELAAGAWRIGPAPTHSSNHASDSDLVAPYATVIEIDKSESDHQIDIQVDRGLYIRGRVVDEEGKSIAGASIEAMRADCWIPVSAKASLDGSFQIGPLEHGTHVLSASFVGAFPSSDRAECEAGAIDVLLRMQKVGSIAGIVIDGRTRKPVQAGIKCSRASQADPRFSMATTDSSGTFHFTGLPAGVYSIVATDSGDLIGIERAISLDAGVVVKDIAIALEPCARVRVRRETAHAAGGLVVESSGSLVAADVLLDDMWREFRVPKGSVTLRMRVLDGGDETERTIEISAGQTKEVVFGKDDK